MTDAIVRPLAIVRETVAGHASGQSGDPKPLGFDDPPLAVSEFENQIVAGGAERPGVILPEDRGALTFDFDDRDHELESVCLAAPQ